MIATSTPYSFITYCTHKTTIFPGMGTYINKMEAVTETKEFTLRTDNDVVSGLMEFENFVDHTSNKVLPED